MIGKIKRGKDFGGVCKYVLKGGKEVAPRIIGSNMEGKTPDRLAAEFETISAFNDRVKVPVKHFSIAFAPEDGVLTDDAKMLIAIEYLEKMGYGNSQYVVVSHDRTDHNHQHDHLHIVANAVDLNGKWVDDRLDFKRSKKVCRSLEQQFKLTPVTSQKNINRDKSANPSRDRRVERLVVAGTPLSAIELTREKIQTKIDAAALGASSMTQFCARLQTLGLEPIPRITRTGKIQGLSYKQGDVVTRGSDLHDASFPALIAARGIGYNERRDLPSLKAVGKGGQLEPDREWLDRLPEIQADLERVTIPMMPKNDGWISIDMAEAQREYEAQYPIKGQITINMAEAQREAEAQHEAQELAAREIEHDRGGYEMRR